MFYVALLILLHPTTAMGLFKRGYRPHRPTSQYRRLDLYLLHVSTIHDLDDLALVSLLVGFKVNMLCFLLR